jgi:SNF2 family DNA or RNA helicase
MPTQNAELNDNSIDVIVTSWEIALREGITKSKKYAALIVDEGHRLKNRESRLWKRLGEVASNFRLLLSGTPIQNRVTELLNLLYFLDKDVISVCLHIALRVNSEHALLLARGHPQPRNTPRRTLSKMTF